MSVLSDPARLDEVEALRAHELWEDPWLSTLARRAALRLDVPVGFVSILLDDAMVLAGQHGFGSWAVEAGGIPSEWSLCQHVVGDGEPWLVTDTSRDPRAAGTVATPMFGIGAYAGVPIVSERGHVLGAFCAVHTAPRRWDDGDLAVLTDLSRRVSEYLELRREPAASACD